MDKWEDFIDCTIQNNQCGDVKFEGNGDWSFIIQRKVKEGVQEKTAITEILKQYGLEKLEEQQEPIKIDYYPDCTNFKKALAHCYIKILPNTNQMGAEQENIENQFIKNFQKDREITGCKQFCRFVNDGNTILALYEDENYFYSIFVETS